MLSSISQARSERTRQRSSSTSGEKELVFEVKGHIFGVMICRDQNFPEVARTLRARGAEGVFICSAHHYGLVESAMKRDKNWALPVARAYENGCFVFKANAVGMSMGKISYGGSMIVDPRGIVVLRAGERDEELLVYETDFRLENLRWQ